MSKMVECGSRCDEKDNFRKEDFMRTKLCTLIVILGIIALIFSFSPLANAQGKSGDKGDNKDDDNSGQIDREGDGNSGQGDDLHKKRRALDNLEDRLDKRRTTGPRDRIEDKLDERNVKGKFLGKCRICGEHNCGHLKRLKALLLKKFDADGDGKLSESERATAKEAWKTRRETFVKKFDTNGDGKLGPEERASARKTFAERRQKFLESHPELKERLKDNPRLRDRMEDRRDRREDFKDKREERRDRAEDRWDKKHDGGLKDKLEDRRDRKEDLKDKREDRRDRLEDRKDRGDKGVRDHGKG